MVVTVGILYIFNPTETSLLIQEIKDYIHKESYSPILQLYNGVHQYTTIGLTKKKDINTKNDDQAIIHELSIPEECKQKDALSQNSTLSSTTKCRSLLDQHLPQWKELFEEDGVIAIRGLLSKELMDQLNQSSYELVQREIQKQERIRMNRPGGGGQYYNGKQFFISKMGVSFRVDEDETANKNYKDDEHSANIVSGFRDIALSSIIPQITAELLGMDYHHHANERNDDDLQHDINCNRDDNREVYHDPTEMSSSTSTNKQPESRTDDYNETLRMLRDVFLVKDSGQYICGWHVDDLGFWPTMAESPGKHQRMDCY